MIAHPTPIEGVVVVDTEVRRDDRGEFARLFCEATLASLMGGRHVVQVNRSLTRKTGSIRGLHFQHVPHAETKFVRCLRGRVFDVAVDLRERSSTFLRWHAVELSPENTRMLVIPDGCAHGFQTLAPDCELLYLHTAAYAPAAEGGVAWNDARIGVEWPLGTPPGGGLSPRDAGLPRLSAQFGGLPW